LMEPDQYGPPKLHLVERDKVLSPEQQQATPQHNLSFELIKSISIPKMNLDIAEHHSDVRKTVVDIIFRHFEKTVGNDITVAQTQYGVIMRSVYVGYDEENNADNDEIVVRWNYSDEDLACRALGIINMILPGVH